MDKYLTMTDFSGDGFIPVLKAIVTAIPPFFAVIIFAVWVLGTATSYFTILKTTGKKRFWHSLTAMSFVSFLLSLTIVAMNDAEVIMLSGYWVGFYIVCTIGSWLLLDNYK